jgi:hypothetical protein
MPVCCEISLLKVTRSDKAKMAMPARSQNPPATQRGDLDVSPLELLAQAIAYTGHITDGRRAALVSARCHGCGFCSPSAQLARLPL